MSPDQVTFHDLSSFIGIHHHVGDLLLAWLHDLYNGLVLAQANTAGLSDGYLACKTLFLDQGGQGI